MSILVPLVSFCFVSSRAENIGQNVVIIVVVCFFPLLYDNEKTKQINYYNVLIQFNFLTLFIFFLHKKKEGR